MWKSVVVESNFLIKCEESEHKESVEQPKYKEIEVYSWEEQKLAYFWSFIFLKCFFNLACFYLVLKDIFSNLNPCSRIENAIFGTCTESGSNSSTSYRYRKYHIGEISFAGFARLCFETMFELRQIGMQSVLLSDRGTNA